MNTFAGDSRGTNGAQGHSFGSGMGGGLPIDPGYIMQQAKLALTDPKGCWQVFKAQPDSIPEIYKRYLGPLAALSVIATFLGNVVIGFSVPIYGTFRWPFFGGLVYSIVFFGVMLANVYVAAVILEMLAPKFEGASTRLDTFKLMAYSLTPSWVGGMLGIIPALAPLGALFGIYGFYLLYCGIPVMTTVPESKRLTYFGASILGIIVAAVIIMTIAALVAPMPTVPYMNPQNIFQIPK